MEPWGGRLYTVDVSPKVPILDPTRHSFVHKVGAAAAAAGCRHARTLRVLHPRRPLAVVQGPQRRCLHIMHMHGYAGGWVGWCWPQEVWNR